MLFVLCLMFLVECFTIPHVWQFFMPFLAQWRAYVLALIAGCESGSYSPFSYSTCLSCHVLTPPIVSLSCVIRLCHLTVVEAVASHLCPRPLICRRVVDCCRCHATPFLASDCRLCPTHFSLCTLIHFTRLKVVVAEDASVCRERPVMCDNILVFAPLIIIFLLELC